MSRKGPASNLSREAKLGKGGGKVDIKGLWQNFLEMFPVLSAIRMSLEVGVWLTVEWNEFCWKQWLACFSGGLNEQCMMPLVIHRHLCLWQSSLGEVGRQVIVRKWEFLSYPLQPSCVIQEKSLSSQWSSQLNVLVYKWRWLEPKVPSKSKIIILNINKYEHLSIQRKERPIWDPAERKAFKGLLEWHWALNVEQDINLWARGESNGVNMCLGATLRKGTEVGWGRQW